MRKKLFTLFLAIVASLGTLLAKSGTCGENLTWDLTDGVLTISGTGAMTNYSYSWYSSAPWYSSRSSIKTVNIGNSVRSIGNYAFYECSGLTSVVIGNSVTGIGEDAFSGCTGLTSVHISDVAAWCAISFGGYSDNPLYYAHNLYLNNTLVTDLVIPDGVTSIGSGAFGYCTGLTSVTIPNSVTSIGQEAFSGCSGLTSVTIGNSVTSIGKYAFSRCSSLTSVTIGNSVTSIGEGAFKDCSRLTSVTIPDSVTSIGKYAFEYCSSLTSVTIGNSVTSIGERAFEDCFRLASVTIGNSVISIGNSAFNRCERLTSVDIPNSVTSIGDWTFKDCSCLVSVTIGNSVTSIGSCAFSGCSSLTSVPIPNSVTSIGDQAFSGCSGLTSVTIGNSVTSIGDYAFSGCTGLTSINVANDNPKYCSLDGVLFNKAQTILITYPAGKTNDTYTIPNSVTTIGAEAFSGCTGLTSVTIPNSVTSIGDYAFYKCTGLTSVTIPNSVTSIGEYAFSRCSSLKSVYLLPITPPTIESSTFKNINSDVRIYLTFGTGQLGTYAIAEYWKELNLYPFMTQNQYVGATSYKISFDIEDITLQSCGISGGEQQPGNVLEYIGLEPNSEYKDVPIVLTSNTGETETVNVSFTTTALTLTTKPSKPVSATTALLFAETNMSDAEVSCGFEYKRNDAPADMEGNKVFCPVANGQMAGRLKNLKDDVYYKYRAFYQSAAGNMYYGDWQYIFTGDVAVEFDPILYTYGATIVRENEATISGYALAGSEDFTEQGFEYWAESRANNGANAPRRMPAAIGEHFFVQASGIALRATLTNLDAGTVYKYRVYGKVGDQYYYGSEQAFTTTGTYTPPTYTITFANWDGALLQSSQVEEGTLPEYTGATPERPEDEQYIYTFNGWSPAIVAATADATYTAQYVSKDKHEGLGEVPSDQVQSTKLLRNGVLYIERNGKTYTVTGAVVK